MNPGFEAIDVDKFKENLIEMGIDCEFIPSSFKLLFTLFSISSLFKNILLQPNAVSLKGF